MIEMIKDNVSIYDLFDRANPRVVYETDQQECQISCPFHGYDTSPSARVYPDSNSMFCWTCSKSWDVIDFWAEINQWEKDGDLDRGKAIRDLAIIYGLRHKRPPWRKALNAALYHAEVARSGYAAYPLEEREAVKDKFAWAISRSVNKVPIEDRAGSLDRVLRIWDDLDSINLEEDSWRDGLASWKKQSKRLLGG